MNNRLYFKLAFTNIKKNAKTYIPYILTCIGSIMMFYIMHFIAANKGLMEMKGGEAIVLIMNLGTVVIGIFSIIFLFYTNSFLIKRRKKEIGLYNILGLEKKHIAKMMFFEIIIVAVTAFVIGIGAGILFSKLLFALLMKLMQFEIALGFYISTSSIVIAAILFAGIFVLTLAYNLLQVKMSKPIELLRGSQMGEKEPKTKWITAIIGVISIGIGYYLALSVQNPIESISKFFVAVLFVIIGTYCIFIAVSIAVLKFLRNRKSYYYQTKHFTTVSGMMYRMKQNAAGLASICILSTMVLVMVSATVALYLGMEDSLAKMYPREYEIIGRDPSTVIEETAPDYVKEFLESNQMEYSSFVNFKYQIFYQTSQKENKLVSNETGYFTTDQKFILLISQEDYNRVEGKQVSLQPGEVLAYISSGSFDYPSFYLNESEYKVVEYLKEMKDPYLSSVNNSIMDSYLFVVNEKDYKKELQARGENDYKEELYIGFNTSYSKEKNLEIAEDYRDVLVSYNKANDGNFYLMARAEIRNESLALYGGLFFLGIFLGTLFMMATVLIIYYKQISEGYDDRERFQIMQKVGMSHKEVKKSIRSQVLLVFFLPLVAALIHVLMAFNMISKCLSLVILSNSTLFLLCTIFTAVVFTIIYTVIFILTAKSYYKIVQ